MQLANIVLKLNDYSTVPEFDVTPAQALLLQAMHGKHAGGDAIVAIEVVNGVTRTPADEKKRLQDKYDHNMVEKLFPGLFPKMPNEFTELDLFRDKVVNKLPAGPTIPDEPLAEEPQVENPEAIIDDGPQVALAPSPKRGRPRKVTETATPQE